MTNIPFEQSPNYTPAITNKTVIVFHGTLGGYVGSKEALTALERLDASGRNIGRASAHLLIGRDGKAVGLVKPNEIAWHVGRISNPKQNFLQVAKKNPDGTFVAPNDYCIGIEFCWGYDADGNKKVDPSEMRCTDAQLAKFNEYLKDLVERGLFTLTGQNIISHSDIADYKSDNLSADIERFYSFYYPQYTHLSPQKVPVFTARLKFGDSNDQVRTLQALLRKLGFFNYPTNTGSFYSVTEAALKQFQSCKGLSPTGVVDNSTMKILNDII